MLASDDQPVARAMNACCATFAETGNLNVPGLLAWPRCEDGSKPVLDLALHGPVGGADPWRERLDRITELAMLRTGC